MWQEGTRVPSSSLDRRGSRSYALVSPLWSVEMLAFLITGLLVELSELIVGYELRLTPRPLIV